ncbi:MAG: hypothetical protein AB8G18_10345 [Gammaproteobacteria bacterium]
MQSFLSTIDKHPVIWFLCLLPVLLSCSSLQNGSAQGPTIPLSKTFEASAEAIKFNKPQGFLPFKKHNQQLSNYVVSEAHRRTRTEKTELTDVREKRNSLLKELIFDSDPLFLVEEYEISGSTKFGFSLGDKVATKWRSECEAFTKDNASLKVTNQERNTGVIRSRRSFSDRLETFLACSIISDNENWQLIIKPDENGTMNFALTSGEKSYAVRATTDLYELVEGKNGPERRSLPPWVSGTSGVEIFSSNEQLSALPFVGEPIMWVKENLPPNKKELLLAVNYSLSMFDWFDDNWR